MARVGDWGIFGILLH